MSRCMNSCDNKYWYNDNDLYHKEDGPAIEYSSGEKEWWVNGLKHREDGPAIEWSNTKLWYINGKRHREDGPAVELSDGTKKWYYKGKQIQCKSNEEFFKIMKMKAFW